jgi:hypothetical protein
MAAGAIVWVSTVRTASAQGQPAPPPPAPELPATTETREVWYGAPMLAMDAASTSLLVAGSELLADNLVLFGASTPAQVRAENAGGAMFLGGYAGFLLGPPIEHWLHGQRDRGMKSLLLRLLLPPAALLSGAGLTTMACGNHDGCGDAVMGTMLGGVLLGTVLVDDVLSARQLVPVRPSDGSLLVVPQVTVGRFTSVGLAAEF